VRRQVGILGNRNLGSNAYDNMYRMMRRFSDKWYCDTSTSCSPEQYTAAMAASPWFTGLAKADLPLLYGDGSASWAANEDDFIDRSEIYQKVRPLSAT
jgi:hypothetical protein